MINIGDKIEIISGKYAGKTGTVTNIINDLLGEKQIHGTWGEYLLESIDEFKVIVVSDRIIRENMSMTQTSFYLDDLTKLRVIRRLKALGLDTDKGTISATIRVLLRRFTEQKEDATLVDEINSEYLFTTKKNKRSTM
jgi:Arc/MetJ family transcription regulator